jgi:phage-related minor tail protein
MSRTFETGWKKAMNTYVESATDASKTAAELFTKATKGMEDAIVGFAKTGKFEWKSFAADMLETLLRSQIQQTFAAMMGGMKDSAGGLMGAIGGLFGSPASTSGGAKQQDTGIMGAVSSIFGGGGGKDGTPVFVTNWPGGSSSGGAFSAVSDLLGTKGGSGGGVFDSVINGIGDLFSSPTDTSNYSANYASRQGFGGGMFDSAINGIGDLFSNSNQDTSQYGSNYASRQGFGYTAPETSVLEDLSSAVDSFTTGISDFFGGFFAGGGSLPAGKFGIVGEKGPEMITGPANISPLGASTGNTGGNTTVVYNINANDAASFAQMLARDPSLIYALTQQGAKGIRA